jgi:hypothetical protein
MEYAACAEDTGVCEVLDGGDEVRMLCLSDESSVRGIYGSVYIA